MGYTTIFLVAILLYNLAGALSLPATMIITLQV